MKRFSICCLVLAFLAVTASGYLVHEKPEEDDETFRGKRQHNGAAVIDGTFNIPITPIKQTSVAAQTLSPTNAATIDNVLKIPVSTLEAVSSLIKNRQREQNQNDETIPSNATGRPAQRLQRRYETTTSTLSELLRREETKKRVEAQRESQRHYQEQLQRRRIEQLQKYTRRMEQRISEENERTNHRLFRDPFGFNSLTKWIVGPQGTVFNGHAGHGDGHVYQYFDEQKPLHFGGQGNQRRQDTNRPIPTKPTLPQGSSTTSSSSVDTTTTTTTTTTSTTTSSNPNHGYEVHEVVDEGVNPFTWPNWFGIIQTLTSAGQTYTDDRIQNKIAPKRTKVKFDESPLENKIATKDEEMDYYKAKYQQARKNQALEVELTGNEIDGDVGSGENRHSGNE